MIKTWIEALVARFTNTNEIKESLIKQITQSAELSELMIKIDIELKKTERESLVKDHCIVQLSTQTET